MKTEAKTPKEISISGYYRQRWCQIWSTIIYGAIRDTTRHDTTRHDTTRHDTTRHDTTRHDTTRHYTTLHDTTRHDTTRHDTTRHDTIRYDTIRYDTIRYDTIRYDSIQSKRLLRQHLRASTTMAHQNNGFSRLNKSAEALRRISQTKKLDFKAYSENIPGVSSTELVRHQKISESKICFNCGSEKEYHNLMTEGVSVRDGCVFESILSRR